MPIFLSHSGKQKPFVENLFNALERANHTAFFDQYTLPKASTFPPRIKTAALGCEVGVVVLSEEFLTSKWPMIELEILVLQRGPTAKVLPLFYKLGPADLKCPESLSRWRQVWEEKAGGAPEVVAKWGEALRALCAFNGEVYTEGTSEASYTERVVRNLCKEVPCPLPEDLSQIKGLRRLAKEVAGYFDNLRRCEEACVIGLHGLVGSGKTTICKIMVNSYSAEFPGRCHYLVLPTEGKDLPQIVQGCKKALKKLTNLNDEVLHKADNFDQVIQLMRNHLSQLDVFLAIDNIWESSLDAVKRILGAGLSANSKVLLTSQSEQVLRDVLPVRNDAWVRPLPALEHEEAFEIFQEAFGEDAFGALENYRDQVDCIVERFSFAGNYHALALKALGAHVRKGWRAGSSTKNKKVLLSSILGEMRMEDLGPLENAIRLGYDKISEHKKHLFLDIAAWILLWDAPVRVTFAIAHQLLSVLYKDQFPETRISTLIYELALDGLVQLEADGQHDESIVAWAGDWGLGTADERIVRVHDLITELAQREAATRSTFFISGRWSKPLEEFGWENAERVILGAGGQELEMNMTQLSACPKLQVLYAAGVNFVEGIDMCCTPALRVLHLKDVKLRRIKNWSAASRLVIVFLSNITAAGIPYDRISGTRQVLYKSMRVFDLNALSQLQVLCMEKCHGLERMKGLDSLKSLQSLLIRDCNCLENLDGLSALRQLKLLHVARCQCLKKIPDLRRLTCLEELVLEGNEKLEGVGGFSPTNLSGLTRSDLDAKITGLTRLVSSDLDATITGLTRLVSSDLDVKKMSGLTSLVSWKPAVDAANSSTEEAGGRSVSSTLKRLTICDCKRMRRFPGLKGCIHLREVAATPDAVAVVASSAPPNLHTLRLIRGEWLSSSEQWRGLTALRELVVQSVDARRIDLGCLSPLVNLKSLAVFDCFDLEAIANTGKLQGLEHLKLTRCPHLKRLDGFKDIQTCDLGDGVDFLHLQRCQSRREGIHWSIINA